MTHLASTRSGAMLMLSLIPGLALGIAIPTATAEPNKQVYERAQQFRKKH